MTEIYTESDLRDVFYPYTFSEGVRAEIKASKAWPVLLTLRAELELFVYSYTPNNKLYALCDRWGFRQIMVREEVDNGKEKLFLLTFDHSLSMADPKEYLESAHAKYLVSRISKLVRENANPINKINARGLVDLTEHLKDAIVYTANNFPDDTKQKYWPRFGQDMREHALRVMMGEIDKHELPVDILHAFDKEAQIVRNMRNKNLEFREKIRPYLEGPKFVFISYGQNVPQFVMGGITLTNLDEVLNEMYLSEYSWTSVGSARFDISYPFQRYWSLESIPEAARDVVNATVQMDKLNRTSKKRFDDSQGFIPWVSNSTALFENASTWCFRLNNSYTALYVIPDKRGLLV